MPYKPYPDQPRVNLVHAYEAANTAAADCYGRALRLGQCPATAASVREAAFASALADVLPVAPPRSHRYPPDLEAC